MIIRAFLEGNNGVGDKIAIRVPSIAEWKEVLTQLLEEGYIDPFYGTPYDESLTELWQKYKEDTVICIDKQDGNVAYRSVECVGNIPVLNFNEIINIYIAAPETPTVDVGGIELLYEE